MRSLFALAALSVLSSSLLQSADACTAILVSRGASTDGSTMTTHNNDCTDCDFRLSVVPSGDYEEGDKCPIYPCSFSFPRHIGTTRGPTYFMDNTKPEAVHLDYKPSQPIHHIPQVKHTHSYIDGSYGIANEHGLAMGESTCAARLVAYGPPLGDAKYDIAELSRLALQRCTTARCACQLMGDLAVESGYYGANDPPEVGAGMYEESGEALTIIDPKEAWVFHILPDDTGRSAVWAAQRLEEGHFTVVANEFIIRQMNLDDTDNFLGSKNMKEVAVRAGLWPGNSTEEFDFSGAFAPDANNPPGWAERRTWHLYNWVAPSKGFKPDQKEPYPFSVKVEKKLSVEDVFQMSRDHFEGTEFDLSVGPASGPYNNPNRYDRRRRPEYEGGFFERGISLHRTIYSVVAQAREWVADPFQTVVWFAHHAPHSSLYIPFYGSTQALPEVFQTGTLYELRRSNAWWAFAAVENYAEKMFNYINADVVVRQKKLEGEAQETIKSIDAQGKELMDKGKTKEALELSTDWTVKNAKKQVEDWWSFFDFLICKFRDGQVMMAFEPPMRAIPVFYPAWWLGRVGYYDKGPSAAEPVNPPPPGPPHPEFLEQLGLAGMAADMEGLKGVKRVVAPAHASLAYNLFEQEGMSLESMYAAPRDAMVLSEKATKASAAISHLSGGGVRVAPSADASTTTAPSSTHAPLASSWSTMIVGAALCLAVGAGSFYAGTRYQRSHDYMPISQQ